MLLAIDVGNTHTKFALCHAQSIRHCWRRSTNAAHTADDYMAWLYPLMGLAHIGTDQISGAIISSVVPATVSELRALCRTHFQCTPMVVGEKGVDSGVELRVDSPHEVGADRIVLSSGAAAFHGPDTLVIAFGTATTFNMVSDGAYIGGAIAPGPLLMARALRMSTAQLPHIAIQAPVDGRALAQGTVASMQAGVVLGYVDLVEGLIGRMSADIGKTIKIVGTGGHAGMFKQHIPSLNHVDPDLMIRGLAHIHTRNL